MIINVVSCTYLDNSTDPPTPIVYPNVDELFTDANAIEHYQQRASQTTNPIRRARYADIVWVALHRHSQNDDAYEYAIEAAQAYLSQVALCLNQDESATLTSVIDRAAELAVQLNNKNLASDVVETIIEVLEQLQSAQRFRWILELSDTLEYISSKYDDLVTNEMWYQINEIASSGIEYFENDTPQRNLHLTHALLRLASNTSERLGNSTEAWEYRVQIADSFAREAQEREQREGVGGGASVAYKFMESAMHEYQQLLSLAPNHEERDRLRQEVKKSRQEIRRLIRLAEREMTTITESVHVPQEALDRLVAPFHEADSEETFRWLSHMGDLLPDVQHIRQQASEAAQKFIHTSLAGRTVLRDGRKVDEISAGEGETNHFLTFMGVWLYTHSQLLDFVFTWLREEDILTVENFANYLSSWEFFDEADMPFVVIGLERYFDGDHISALHVLTPRIEHMLKSAFEQSGIPSVSVPNRRQIREQTLGEFLHRDEVTGTFHENVWHYLYYVLVDERFLNLRSDVAHGWIEAPRCNRVSVQMILFTLLLLTGLSRPRPKG